MRQFFTDEKGNLSHKRLINVITSVSGIAMAWAMSYKAFRAGTDIPDNVVLLILSMIGTAGALSVLSNVVEKIGGKK